MLERPVTNKICLAVERLTKRFGALYALNDVSFEVAAGHIHALIGPNGAGKTTFFNLVTGALPADDGRIVFEGEEISDGRPFRRTLKGIAALFRTSACFRT